MLKILCTLLILLAPLAALAQCGSVGEEFFGWIYSIFGDKILKVFGVLYGVSLVFKLLDLVISKFVLTTKWTWDDEFRTKVTKHWLYVMISFSADVFLRLKLPGRKK